jgi:hypothetical protein
MFRISSYLAIALSVTAIAAATTPAAALSSQFVGGAGNHLATQFHPAPAVTSIQPSQQISHLGSKTADYPPKIPMPQSPGVSTSVGSSKYPLPKYPGVGQILKNPEIPVAQLPTPKFPNPIDNVCPDNPFKCPPKGSGSGGGSGSGSSGGSGKTSGGGNSGGGPIVIIAPQVPVQVPVAVPYGVPSRVISGQNDAVATQARPSVGSQPIASHPIVSQCGANSSIPPLAAGIDQLLPTAQLSQDDIAKVTELRQTIQDMSAAGKVAAARNVEEVAMYYLGYQKIWLQCGAGTFAWAQTPGNNAGQSSNQAVAQSAVQSK